MLKLILALIRVVSVELFRVENFIVFELIDVLVCRMIVLND